MIAELDGAFTKYHEVTLEARVARRQGTFVRGSYTWSHYYGNFDQDNTTGSTTTRTSSSARRTSPTARAASCGTSSDGDLRGDRPHLLEALRLLRAAWNATAGAYFVAQSGQPWEMWSYEPYIALTTNTSDSTGTPSRQARADRHALPARPELHAGHPAARRGYSLQLAVDLFNVANRQTGYNYRAAVHIGTAFETPRNFYDPRRFQVARDSCSEEPCRPLDFGANAIAVLRPDETGLLKQPASPLAIRKRVASVGPSALCPRRRDARRRGRARSAAR